MGTMTLAASGGGHGGQESSSEVIHHIPNWAEVIKPLILRAINFIGFGALLYFLLRKPISKFLTQRRANIEEDIQESAKKKKWAEEKFNEYQKRLNNIEQEIQALNVSLKKEGELESQEIIENAKKLAESIKKDAALVAGAEMADLRIDLRNQAVEMAALVARETLQSVLNEKDEERYSKEFLKELRSKSA